MRAIGSAVTLLVALLVCLVTPARGAPEAKSAEEPGAPSVLPRHFLRHGGRRIQSGLRLESFGQGVQVADKVFPQGGDPRGLAVPQHLGGGYLFFQPLASDGASATAFYRAQSFTGPLTPLATIPFAAQHVEFGFDRIYALGVGLKVALDVHSGEILPLSPLPEMATVSALAFDGPRRGLVEGPIAGVLYSGDSGTTWARVEGAHGIELDLSSNHLMVRTEGGLAIVDESGSAVSVRETDIDSSRLRTVPFERVLSGSVRPEELINRPFIMSPGSKVPLARFENNELTERRWVSVLTRGVVHGGAAWAVDRGKLLRLALSGKLDLSSEPTEISDRSECFATKVRGKAAAQAIFVCQGPRTEVWSLSVPKSPKDGAPASRLRSIWRARPRAAIATWGLGAALFRGKCAGGGGDSHACLVDAVGSQDVVLPPSFARGDVNKALAVRSGEARAIWFDRAAQEMKMKVLYRRSKAASSALSGTWTLPADHSISEFLRAGAMLQRASFTPDGVTFWATHREKFVGVLLADSDKLAFGAVQRPLRRAALDGPRAVLWGAAGFAKQTTDGGLSYSELSLPYQSGDPDLAVVGSPGAAVTVGCSPVGCALGRLLKLGWDVPSELEVELPQRRSFVLPGARRLRFTCFQSESSPERRSTGLGSFPDFWEERAPQLSGGTEGSSVGFPGDVARLYAWGPVDVAWSRTGRAQAYFIDPWDSTKVHKTAPTFQLFSSTLDAKARMGLVDRTSGFRYLSFDPKAAGGVMVLRGRSSTELLVFQEGKPLERFSGATELGLRNLKGAVLSRGSFVAAFQRGSLLTLVRLVGGSARPIVDLPLGDDGNRGVRLVRTDRGDLGVSIEGDSGLFVYPVSDAGELGTPVVVPHGSKRPNPCPPEASGYWVDRELAVAPYLETPDESPIPVSQVRAKMVVGYGEACFDSMRGRTRGLEGVTTAAQSGGTIPLAVLNTESSGRRLELQCQ